MSEGKYRLLPKQEKVENGRGLLGTSIEDKDRWKDYVNVALESRCKSQL